MYFGLLTLINQIIEPTLSSTLTPEERNKAIGLMGVSMLSAGFFGSMAIGRALDITKKYKLVMISTSAVCCLAQVVFTLVVAKGLLWLDHVILAVLGICGTAMINLTVQYGIELTYPQPVPVMAGLTCLFAQLFGLVVTELGKYRLSHLKFNREGSHARQKSVYLNIP